MFLCKFLLFVALSVQWSEIVSAATDKVVCYHGSWSAYRNGNGKFVVEDIDPFLCTHIIYTFVGLNTDGTIRILDSWNEIDNRGFTRFNALKKTNPKLKTLVAIGGWNEGSITYSRVAASATSRQALIKSAVNLLATYGFDGFDLDWEYPAQRGGAAADKKNYVTLLQEFRKEFDKYGYLLTAAVAAAGPSVDLSYDVPNLSKYLDFINVMAYDLHGSYDGVAGINGPLYPSPVDVTSYQKELNVDACIRGWIRRGAASEKLVLGVGTYGQSYTLSNVNNNKIGDKTSGPGVQGPYTFQAGMLGYNELCELQKQGGWTVKWSEEQQVPYAYKNNQWVGYDNQKSATIKAQYAKSLNLGGVMIWSIETDDFRGICGTKYPILNALKAGLGSSVTSTSAPPASSSTTKSTTTTAKSTTKSTTKTTTAASPPPSSGGELCTKVEYVRDPENCNKFYYCSLNNGIFVPIPLSCPAGLCYNQEKHSCAYSCPSC